MCLIFIVAALKSLSDKSNIRVYLEFISIVFFPSPPFRGLHFFFSFKHSHFWWKTRHCNNMMQYLWIMLYFSGCLSLFLYVVNLSELIAAKSVSAMACRHNIAASLLWLPATALSAWPHGILLCTYAVLWSAKHLGRGYNSVWRNSLWLSCF